MRLLISPRYYVHGMGARGPATLPPQPDVGTGRHATGPQMALAAPSPSASLPPGSGLSLWVQQGQDPCGGRQNQGQAPQGPQARRSGLPVDPHYCFATPLCCLNPPTGRPSAPRLLPPPLLSLHL
jgi:hypothetical protein